MSGLNPNHIEELLHTLQTLDVELYELARCRQVTEAEYSIRNDRLRYAFHTLGGLSNVVSQQENPNEFKSQIDLPIISGFTRAEQKVVMHFVSDTMRHTQKLSTVAANIAKWSLEAAANSVGTLKTLWRLSWLRGSHLQINQDLASVRKARQVVETFIERTAMGDASPDSKRNQQDLLTAFCEFDATNSRVAAMRSGLSRETTRNQDMRRWLSRYSQGRRTRNPEESPPEPQAVQDAVKMISDPICGGAEMARKRLVIATQVQSALTDWESAKRAELKVAKDKSRKLSKEKQKMLRQEADRPCAPEVSGDSHANAKLRSHFELNSELNSELNGELTREFNRELNSQVAESIGENFHHDKCPSDKGNATAVEQVPE